MMFTSSCFCKCYFYKWSFSEINNLGTPSSEKEINVYFLIFICNIFVRKIFFCNILMMLNNFMIDFFPVSCTVFEIKTVTPNFATRWCCQLFPCIAHGNFTIPRPNFYDLALAVQKLLGWQRTLADTLYIIKCSVSKLWFFIHAWYQSWFITVL